MDNKKTKKRGFPLIYHEDGYLTDYFHNAVGYLVYIKYFWGVGSYIEVIFVEDFYRDKMLFSIEEFKKGESVRKYFKRIKR